MRAQLSPFAATDNRNDVGDRSSGYHITPSARSFSGLQILVVENESLLEEGWEEELEELAPGRAKKALRKDRSDGFADSLEGALIGRRYRWRTMKTAVE